MITQKYRGKQLRKYQMVSNIIKYYQEATSIDIRDGKRWYQNANEFCQHLSYKYNLPIEKVAGIVSALSPQNSWEINKSMAETFIQRKGKGRVKNRACDQKAKNIYNADDISQIENMLSFKEDGAFKTKSFYKNIINPQCNNSVTIDRHALAVCIQNPERTRALNNMEAKITKRQYEFFQDCYRTAALKLGISPAELQACSWLSYRNKRSLSVYKEWKPIETDVEF